MSVEGLKSKEQIFIFVREGVSDSRNPSFKNISDRDLSVSHLPSK